MDKGDIKVIALILTAGAIFLFFVLTAKAIGYNEGYSDAIDKYLLEPREKDNERPPTQP